MSRRASRFFAATAVAVILSLYASPAHAAKSSSDDDEEIPDARLVGYPAQTKVDIGGGTAMSYLLLGFLGAIAVGVTFKGSGRSHLD